MGLVPVMLSSTGSIIAGDNTAKKMLAWTEAGKKILQDEFSVIFEKIPVTEDWEACTIVLDNEEKLKQLLMGW